ncbi:general stress protein [Solicola sp. PLA-1-18]|uniref:general stress protein n=1 Tax=Solicola sp. PLA-1-18 TaxID=3380532 RepID=UPI003B8000AE
MSSTYEIDATQPTGPAGEVTVASFDTYAEAERAVDHLADSGFAVEGVTVVGRGVKTVEFVTGRMGKGRAALSGAASGAWLGLFFGLLLGLFAPGVVWLSVLLTSLVIGAFWGAALGFVAQWATRGRRDFSSARTLAASRYDVNAPADRAAEASDLLAILR